MRQRGFNEFVHGHVGFDEGGLGGAVDGEDIVQRGNVDEFGVGAFLRGGTGRVGGAVEDAVGEAGGVVGGDLGGEAGDGGGVALEGGGDVAGHRGGLQCSLTAAPEQRSCET